MEKETKSNDKVNMIVLTVIASATFLTALIGSTFAYFTAQAGKGASANVDVTTATSDSLVYGTWTPINITATQQNFGQGAASLTGETTGKITLTASTTGEASFCYTSTITISGNNFVYSQAANTPELLLSVTKNTVDVITDMDITTSTATIQIPTVKGNTVYQHKITATAGTVKEDAWKAKVTFVNLPADQQKNTGKNFTGLLKFDTVTCV
ncbi:MAG: hypothetical protein RSE17_02500 [Bacilli bacterium]